MKPKVESMGTMANEREPRNCLGEERMTNLLEIGMWQQMQYVSIRVNYSISHACGNSDMQLLCVLSQC